MPLDLQRGSKFAILRDSVQVERKHAAGSPDRVKACRNHEGLRTSQNGSMPLDLQRGSKLAVLMRDCVQVKRKHALDRLQRGSKFTVLIRDRSRIHTSKTRKACRWISGEGRSFPCLRRIPSTPRCYYLFFKRKPWRIDPKPYVQKIAKRTPKDDSILKKSTDGQEMEGKRKKLIRSSSNESCYLTFDGWIPKPHVRAIQPRVHTPNSLSRCHDYRPFVQGIGTQNPSLQPQVPIEEISAKPFPQIGPIFTSRIVSIKNPTFEDQL